MKTQLVLQRVAWCVENSQSCVRSIVKTKENTGVFFLDNGRNMPLCIFICCISRTFEDLGQMSPTPWRIQEYLMEEICSSFIFPTVF